MAAPPGSDSSTPRPGTSQPAEFLPEVSGQLTAPTNKTKLLWDKLRNRVTEPESPKTPKVEQAGPASFPDKEYFESYAKYYSKHFRQNRKVEIRAFISLQHLIIERFGQHVESLNDKILQTDVNELDELKEAHSFIHTYCEAIDDLEKMLERPTPKIVKSRRKQDRAYLRSLTERGIELRLVATGYPTAMSKAMTLIGSILIGPLLTYFGIIILLLPMVLILFIPELSKIAAVGIIIGSLFALSVGLNSYSFYLQFLDAIGMPIASREIMSGKEILGNLAAYAAVLFVFIGAYLSPDQKSGQSPSSSNSTANSTLS